jgi:prevent-host-death family protein
MKATSKDLRFHTKEILDAAVRGEDVVITYRGKPYVKIIPIPEASSDGKQNDFCGMWKDRDDMEDVETYVRNKRKGRSF